MANAYYLSLGGNIDAEANLPRAVQLLRDYGRITAVSSVYESPPEGTSTPQPNYLNAVVLVVADLEPSVFRREAIGTIERRLGRVRTADRYAARPIDIDILLIDGQILELDGREIPSREIVERSFVAVPLAEIAPDLRHPQTGETMRAIADRFLLKPDALRLRPDVCLLPQ